jgi:hypothetical protein
LERSSTTIHSRPPLLATLVSGSFILFFSNLVLFGLNKNYIKNDIILFGLSFAVSSAIIFLLFKNSRLKQIKLFNNQILISSGNVTVDIPFSEISKVEAGKGHLAIVIHVKDGKKTVFSKMHMHEMDYYRIEDHLKMFIKTHEEKDIQKFKTRRKQFLFLMVALLTIGIIYGSFTSFSYQPVKLMIGIPFLAAFLVVMSYIVEGIETYQRSNRERLDQPEFKALRKRANFVLGFSLFILFAVIFYSIKFRPAVEPSLIEIILGIFISSIFYYSLDVLLKLKSFTSPMERILYVILFAFFGMICGTFLIPTTNFCR